MVDSKSRLVIDLQERCKVLSAALFAINGIAGNLSDKRVEAIGGVNDGKSRAIMVVEARKLAYTALVETVYLPELFSELPVWLPKAAK
jgi:hypothetical protein